MDTTKILFEAHSGWRYLIILVLVLALLKFLIGLLGKQRWAKVDQVLGAMTPIVVDIQWLLGIMLWIVEQRWFGNDPLASWEHPVTMTLALIAGHSTWTRVKRAAGDAAKFRIAFLGFLITALLIALGVARITRFI